METTKTIQSSDLTRRKLAKSAAWSVPVVAASLATPGAQASPSGTITVAFSNYRCVEGDPGMAPTQISYTVTYTKSPATAHGEISFTPPTEVATLMTVTSYNNPYSVTASSELSDAFQINLQDLDPMVPTPCPETPTDPGYTIS